MHISNINYQKTFNIGSYQSIKIGVEMVINEGDNAEEGMDNLRVFVNEYFTKHAPTEEQRGTQVRDIVEPMDKRIAVIIEDIQGCDVLDVKNAIGVQVGLLGYAVLAKTHPDIEAAYLKRLEELTIKK